MNHIQFIEELIGLGYKFCVVPNNDRIVVELSFNQSCFRDGEEIAPPKELPQLPYKITTRKDEEYDEFYIVFIWSFVTNEWPAEPPRQ